MEQPQPNPETTRHQLTDVTDRVRSQLDKLCGTRGEIDIKPTDLFVVAPGLQANWTEYIDKDCRGGWTEHRNTTLDDAPYQITELSKKYSSFSAELKRDGSYVGSLGLNGGNMKSTIFLEGQEAVNARAAQSHADEFIHKWTNKPYSHLHRISEYFDDRYDVVATSRDPLEDPIQLRSRDRVETLKHEIENLEMMTQGGDTYAKLHLVTSYPRSETEWIPLEHLKFDLKERDPKTLLNQRLFRAATRLLAYYDSAPIHLVDRQSPPVEELNTFLERSVIPVKYEPDTGVRDRFYETPLFVIATPNNSGVENIRRVSGNREAWKTPYINADKLLSSDSSLWVVDENSDLAVPFTQPTLSPKRPDFSYDIHLTDYLLKHKK